MTEENDLNLNREMDDLESKIEDKKISEINSLKQRRSNNLDKAKQLEEELFNDKKSISDMWNESMDSIVSIYNEGKEFSNTKKKVWDSLRKNNVIDLYKRDANKKIHKIEQKANSLTNRIRMVNQKLYGVGGEGGYFSDHATIEKLASIKANTRIDTKNLYEKEQVQRTKINKELEALYSTSEENRADNHFEEIEVKEAELESIDKNLKMYSNEFKKLGRDIKRIDKRVTTKGRVIAVLEDLYESSIEALDILKSEIDVVKDYVGDFDLLRVDLAQLSGDVEQAISYGKQLDNVENILGDNLEKTTSRIYANTEEIKKSTENKPYLDKMKERSDSTKQSTSLELDELTTKYATIPGR